MKLTTALTKRTFFLSLALGLAVMPKAYAGSALESGAVTEQALTVCQYVYDERYGTGETTGLLVTAENQAMIRLILAGIRTASDEAVDVFARTVRKDIQAETDQYFNLTLGKSGFEQLDSYVSDLDETTPANERRALQEAYLEALAMAFDRTNRIKVTNWCEITMPEAEWVNYLKRRL